MLFSDKLFYLLLSVVGWSAGSPLRFLAGFAVIYCHSSHYYCCCTGANVLVQAAIKDGFHKELNCRMSVFILYLNQNGNEEWWPFVVWLKQAQFVVLKPLKKSHLTGGRGVVPLIIQSEMKGGCLCFSLVNDAPVPLCRSRAITHWDLEYFQKIIPINAADVFSAGNEAKTTSIQQLIHPAALDTAPHAQQVGQTHLTSHDWIFLYDKRQSV